MNIKQIEEGIINSGLSKKTLMLHTSVKSFGSVEGGPAAILDAFINQGCTIIVPTFSWSFAVPAGEDRISDNGMDYDKMEYPKDSDKIVYDTAFNDIDGYLGATPAALLKIKGRVRGSNPLSSFAGYGPFAAEIIKTQEPMDVFAPLRELAMFKGYVALLGVDLTKMTLLHLAEQAAGRKPFIRWANGADGKKIRVQIGGCSEGFNKLQGILAPDERKLKVGPSEWRIYPAINVLKRAAAAIAAKPGITHCEDRNCIRCNDAEKGGAKY